jgi:Putative prokaryotic signal transducing protein
VPASVRVRTFSNKLEAEMARGLLESCGVSAWLLTDDAGGAYPFQLTGGGVQLMVAEADAAAAEDLLAGS